MAYSRVTRTANGRGALEYAAGYGTGHNQNEHRNMYIGYVNVLPGIDPAEQMDVYWRRARANHKTQVLRIVQSFSTKELNPQDGNDILTANLIGQEFAKKYYPDRQAVVFTQIDGRSGLVHNHVIVSDTDMISSKGCEKEQYHFPKVKEWTNEIASQYFELDTGIQQVEDKTTQTERHKREVGEYVWKDDLKERITETMTEAQSESDWIEKLPAHGVNIEVHDSKKKGRYYTYELMDTSQFPEGKKIPANLKSRSYKLGTLYDAEHVQEYFKEKEAELELTRKRKHPEDEKKVEPVTEEQLEPVKPEKGAEDVPVNTGAEVQRRRKRKKKEEEDLQEEQKVDKKQQEVRQETAEERKEWLMREYNERQFNQSWQQQQNRKRKKDMPGFRFAYGEDGSVRIDLADAPKDMDYEMALQLKSDEERHKLYAKDKDRMDILKQDESSIFPKKRMYGKPARNLTGRAVADRIDREVQKREKSEDRGFGE